MSLEKTDEIPNPMNRAKTALFMNFIAVMGKIHATGNCTGCSLKRAIMYAIM